MSRGNTKPTNRKPTDPITNLQAHIKILNDPVTNQPGVRVIDIEFHYIEQRSKDKVYNPPCTASALACNAEKNRYPDVLPPDTNRVKLKEIPNVEGSDFINANFIMGSNCDPKGYISTQGPMENTVCDFWRLCWDENVRIFAMLTKEVEKGQVKSARYWPIPTDPDRTVTHGNIQIYLLSENTEKEDLIIRIFKIKHLLLPEEPLREMIHFQYTGWPDHGVPPSTKHFLQLIELVDTAFAERGGPIGVHCSAGIGRTGTFCTVHINIHILRDHYKKNPTTTKPPALNIVNTILLLRKQRPGMVQTRDQFFFCYKAIYDEYMRLWKEAKNRQKLLEDGAAATPQENTEIPSSPPTSGDTPTPATEEKKNDS